VKHDDLTDRQREVVDSTEPIVLVLGDPGTGKTARRGVRGGAPARHPRIVGEREQAIFRTSRCGEPTHAAALTCVLTVGTDNGRWPVNRRRR
jgi:hypothetical protein